MNLAVPRIRNTARGGRQITGRTVLFSLIGFFLFVTLVNVVMIKAAISTFGGVDTPSSYQAGLAFKEDEFEADAQEARGWQVSADIKPIAAGASIAINVLDGAGAPVTGADIAARLAHPIDERRDVAIEMTEIGSGAYSGRGSAESGQWTLDIDISKGGERLFRSRNRVMIK